jgi:hypothetical protein
MYSHQLRGFRLGDATDGTDAPVMIPGFTPALASDQSSGSGFDWSSIVNTVLNDVTQIIRPGSPSPYPVYNPTTTALSNSVRSLAPLLVVGGIAYLATRKRH